jgi:hypothetical protein
MHMAHRAAAWVAWAVWTCNIPQRGIRSKESGLRPALFFWGGYGGGRSYVGDAAGAARHIDGGCDSGLGPVGTSPRRQGPSLAGDGSGLAHWALHIGGSMRIAEAGGRWWEIFSRNPGSRPCRISPAQSLANWPRVMCRRVRRNGRTYRSGGMCFG